MTGMLSMPSRGEAFKRIQSIYLGFGIWNCSGGVVYGLARRMCKLDCFSGTVDQSIMGFQPIHPKDEVYVGRPEDDGRGKEY